MGRTEFFSYELERLTEHFMRRGDGAYDFADALVEGGLPLQAIVLGRELRRMEPDWNLRLLRIVHPLPHRESLLAEATSRGLDPFFVAGVIRQESAWDARIVSTSGAVGLMQLMEPTAREVAGSLGIRFSPELLTDPATNLRLGTTYLRTMLDRFDGRAEDALAAYNAGPGRMRQWREEATYRDRDVFMEHVPFSETRNYVKVVQQYARIYAALYGCGSMEPCLGLAYPEVIA
jgi:soluble lytic murein transglycosylase